MPRVVLKVRWLRRHKGPTQRKLPISLGDLRTLKGMIDMNQIDQSILWETVLLGWFFMLRMSELVGNKKPAVTRRAAPNPDVGHRSPVRWKTHSLGAAC